MSDLNELKRDCWIKAGDHGIYVDKYGIEYIWIYSWFVRWFVLKPVKIGQWTLWFCGIAIHDPVFGTCTPDFNCCAKNVGRRAFIRIPQKNTETGENDELP